MAFGNHADAQRKVAAVRVGGIEVRTARAAKTLRALSPAVGRF
jgi:hypothetical protein